MLASVHTRLSRVLIPPFYLIVWSHLFMKDECSSSDVLVLSAKNNFIRLGKIEIKHFFSLGITETQSDA